MESPSNEEISKENDIATTTDEENEDANYLEERLHRRANSSAAWDYFRITDRFRRVAACSLCGTTCSYRSTTTNLLNHLKRVHGMKQVTNGLGVRVLKGGGKLSDDDSDSDVEVRKPRTLRQPFTFWKYFKRIDPVNKVAICLLCEKKFSYASTTANLKTHIRRIHPDIHTSQTKTLMLANDGQLYEIDETKQEQLEDDDENKQDYTEDDEQKTIDIDSVFLNEYDGNIDVKSKKNDRLISHDEKPIDNNKRKISISANRKRKKGNVTLKQNNSPNEIRDHIYERPEKARKPVISDSESNSSVSIKKRYVNNKYDTLEYFGKYLVSLMKQLPKELSNQLQIDIVKQVITAQSTYDMQKDTQGNTSRNGYTITITEQIENPVSFVPDDSVQGEETVVTESTQ